MLPECKGNCALKKINCTITALLDESILYRKSYNNKLLSIERYMYYNSNNETIFALRIPQNKVLFYLKM